MNTDKESVRVTVEDNGPGIPTASQTRIFEPFEQLDNTYRRHAEGTGLGLALTKELVSVNGGKIGLESEPGKGSKFWFETAGGPIGGDLERRALIRTRLETAFSVLSARQPARGDAGSIESGG